MRNNKKDLQAAKDYAFLLLKFRPRSYKELSQRLKKKRFEEQVINSVLEFLSQNKFIDDNEFAGAWIKSRLKRNLGPRRIIEELKAKGINKQIIDSQLRQLTKDYCQEEIVFGLARSRISKLKGVDPQKAKARVYAFLLRRGFSGGVIMDAIKSL